MVSMIIKFYYLIDQIAHLSIYLAIYNIALVERQLIINLLASTGALSVTSEKDDKFETA